MQTTTVRCMPPGAPDFTSYAKAPFAVEGARNVFLETVKRGEYDAFDGTVDLDDRSRPVTVVLRLYEAFGGHAQARLVVSENIPVVKAFTTNLLEDEDEELYVLRPSAAEGDSGAGSGAEGSVLSLSFRGFEVKTVKLVLGTLPAGSSGKKALVGSFADG